MTAKETGRTAMATALHGMRLDLRLHQAELAEMVGVRRETVSGWECGRSIPSIEQRQDVLARLKNAPAQSLERLAHAFGLSIARPPPPAIQATPSRNAASVRAAMTNAVRAAADDIDVAPSMVRRTLAALLRRMKESDIAVGEIESALVEEKRRA